MDWRKKLYHHEAPPPDKTWAAIADRLKDDPAGLRRRLADQEIPPPAQVWSEIRLHLDQDDIQKEFKTIPIRKMPFWQYAAAAVIVGFTALGVFYLTPHGESPKMQVKMATSISSTAKKWKDSRSLNDSLRNSSSPSIVDTISRNIIHGNADQMGSNQKNESSSAEISEEREKAKVQPKMTNVEGHYIHLAKGMAQYDRISYKCQDLIPCLMKKDKNTSSSTRACTEQVEKWKSQLGKAGFIPSGDNFFDIAEMVDYLKKNK